MTEEQYTTKRRKLKRMKFQHLAREKRAQIEILLKQGLAKTKIAKAVGISRSTINDFQKVLSSNLLRSNFLEFFKVPSPNYTKYIFLHLVYKLHNYFNRKSSRSSLKIAEAVSTLVSDTIKSYIS